jgi:hypothetical protein
MAKPEELLSTQLSNYILDKFNNIPFRFDLVDKLANSVIGKKVKMLHGKWSRGYPDLFIATCRKGYGGLYLELKATNKVPDTDHTRRQAQYHAVLRYNGYKVDFCCGLEDCKKKIKKYLKSK